MMPTREHVRKKRGGDNGKTCPFFLLAEHWLEAMFLFLELLLNKIVLNAPATFSRKENEFNFALAASSTKLLTATALYTRLQALEASASPVLMPDSSPYQKHYSQHYNFNTSSTPGFCFN